MEKRPVDLKRESGGHVDVGTGDDGGIIEMFTIGKKFLVIKEKSVYELLLADDIDPKRENQNLPHATQRLVLNVGTESEIFCRTFLTARKLLKEEYYTLNIDFDKALLISLEALQELTKLDEEISNYLEAEANEIKKYQTTNHKSSSYTIPSIPDINTRLKTIFQKTDHVFQALMEINKLFYTEFSKQSYYSEFTKFVEQQYGAEDLFTKFMQKILPTISLYRNIRNCVDHRRTETKITDFDIQSDSSIISPTIEVDYNGSKLNRVSISTFLPTVTARVVEIFESMLAFIADKNSRTDRAFKDSVVFIPYEKRRNKFINYVFWSPFGDEGFYNQ